MGVREVVVQELGEVRAEGWGEWLHQVFTTQGAIRGQDLRRLASAAQQPVAEAASRRVAADVARTTGHTVAIEPVLRDHRMRIACDGELSNDDSSGFFAIGEEEGPARSQTPCRTSCLRGRGGSGRPAHGTNQASTQTS